MKRFAGTYTAIAVFGLAAQVLGALIMGALIPIRVDPTSPYAPLSPPNALVGGLQAAGIMLAIVVLPFAIQFAAHFLLDRRGPVRRGVWIGLVAFEAVYVVLALIPAWTATTPEGDDNLAWIAVMLLATVAGALFLVALAVSLWLTWRARR